jgi:hypothetical protein
MNPPSEPYYGAIIGHGHDWGEPIPRKVLAQLVAWGMVRDGRLTEYGGTFSG